MEKKNTKKKKLKGLFWFNDLVMGARIYVIVTGVRVTHTQPHKHTPKYPSRDTHTDQHKHTCTCGCVHLRAWLIVEYRFTNHLIHICLFLSMFIDTMTANNPSTSQSVTFPWQRHNGCLATRLPCSNGMGWMGWGKDHCGSPGLLYCDTWLHCYMW